MGIETEEKDGNLEVMKETIDGRDKVGGRRRQTYGGARDGEEETVPGELGRERQMKRRGRGGREADGGGEADGGREANRTGREMLGGVPSPYPKVLGKKPGA